MISIEPFEERHIEDAAKLFAKGYKRQRDAIGSLSEKYANTETIVPLLSRVKATYPGIVAISDGQLIGYLTGVSNIQNLKGTSSGVYIPEWAHHLDSGPDRERTFQSMYTTMSREWVASGCFTHLITAFASDTVLGNLLYWNGFGLLGVDAIRPMDPIDLNTHDSLGLSFTIRRAREDDAESLINLDFDLMDYLSSPPVFMFSSKETEAQIANAFLNDSTISFVAEVDNRIVACIRGTIRGENACTVVRDDSIVAVNFGYTDPSVRGSGIADALLNEVLSWGRSEGKSACSVDFESANVLGRAFWLKHFKALCHSSVRHVDPRVTVS